MASTLDYSNARQSGNTAMQQVIKPAAALDRLDSITDDIETHTRRIEAFIDRFHGNDSREASDETARSSGHAAAIERLEQAVVRLGQYAGELRSIG